MASKLNEEKLEKKFLQVSNSQDSIQTLSLWIIYHKSHPKKIVDIWLKTLKKSKVPHRLVLFYVANDVIQTCKRKSAPQFAEAFSEVLAEATLLVRDEKIRPNVERVFNVWNQRSIFTTEYIEGLRNILTNSKVQSMQPKFVAEFKPQKVMDKIRKIKKIELESVTKLSAVSSSKLDCSSSEIIYQLKDRTHGHQIVHEYDEAVHCLQDYLEIVEKELVERTQLIELLEKGEIFYNAQNGEVKVVANAYRTFSGRVKGLKKKLDDVYATFASPIPSPCSDAPSPTPSEEGPIMSPITETKEEVKEEAALSTNAAVLDTVEEKKAEIRERPEEKNENLPLFEDAPSPSPEPSPKPFPAKTLPSSQSLQLPQGTPTPPITIKSQQQSDGLEEQAPGMMTSWLSAFNTNNPTFTKTFSLDSRVPQTGSLESRLSSLMENLPNLPQVFRTSNYEPLIQSAGSTPIRVDQPNISSPAPIQTTSYMENQSDNGEPGTPVNDENRRDATPVEDEDTRFSVGNTLPLASVMSSLSNEDLHQSLLKSLSHLQQLSASNTPPPVTQTQQVNTTELHNTPVSVTCPTPLENYHQNTPPFSKADASFNSSLPNIPSYLRSPFNLSDIQNAPSIFSAASKLSFPSLSLQPPSPNEDPTKIFGNLGSPPQVYSYATSNKDETQTAVPSMQTDQNYNKQNFNTEEENLEPMDMDLDESEEEEENCSNIIESLPPGTGDVDLRVPPLPQKTVTMPTTWSSCITTDVVAALIPPVSYPDVAIRPELNVNSNSDSHPLESLVSQHRPIQDTQHFNEKDIMADHKTFNNDIPDFTQKCYKDEDMRHHNIENMRHHNIESITHHHLEDISHYNDDVRHHNIGDRRHHNIDDGRHHSVDDGRHHSVDDGRHHSMDDGRHHSIDDGRHHSIDDERHHSIDDERRHSIDDERRHSIDDERHHSIDDERHHSIDDDRHHSIDDGRHHSIEDGRHHSIDDGRHHSIDDGRHLSIDDERHLSIDDERQLSIDDERHLSIDDERHLSIDDERHLSIDDERHLSIDDEGHLSIDDERHLIIDDGRLHSIDDGRHHSVSDGRCLSVNDGRHLGIDDARLHSANDGRLSVDDARLHTVNDGRLHSINDGRHHSVDDGRHHSVDDRMHHSVDDVSHHHADNASHHSVDNASHHSVDDASRHSVNDTSHHSVDDASHHSVDDARQHSLDDVKHPNISDIRHHNINDVRQYNFEDVRQHNIVDLTPHNIEDIRHYSMEDTINPSIDDERHHGLEGQKYQSSSDTRSCNTEDARNQNIDTMSHNTEDMRCHDIAYGEIPESGTNEDTKHKNSPYVERFSSGNVENVRHHNMPYVEGLSGSSETTTTTTTQTPAISTSESNYYPDKYEQCIFQHSISTEMKDEGQVDENRIQTIQSTRQNNDWNEKWNEEPWERQIPPGPMRRRGQPYFRPRFPDYQHRYPQEPYQSYGRRNNYRPRFQVPPFNPRYPPPTHLIPGGRGNFPPRY